MGTEPNAMNGDMQRAKDILVADLKRIVGDADELLKQMSNSTSEELGATRRNIEAKLNEARARIDRARAEVTQKVCTAADSANVYLSENPWRVAGVVSLVGLIAAFLLHRHSCLQADRASS